MSAYGHQMEREFSAQTLLSRGDTVMLQSCESRSKGVVEIEKESDSYHYCKIFALHGELNGLEAAEVPPVCRSLAIQYIEGGEYTRDLNITMRMIESFFDTVSPSHDHLDAVLMDIDDILVSDPWFNQYVCGNPTDCIEDVNYLKRLLTLELYKKLQSRGWPLILLSRKPERQQNVTIEHLNSLGYNGWSSLIMRSDSDMEMDTHEYFSRRRTAMKKEGTQIISVISSQMDALTGSSLGRRVFKLPNPLYYHFENHIESWRLSH